MISRRAVNVKWRMHLCTPNTNRTEIHMLHSYTIFFLYLPDDWFFRSWWANKIEMKNKKKKNMHGQAYWWMMLQCSATSARSLSRLFTLFFSPPPTHTRFIRKRFISGMYVWCSRAIRQFCWDKKSSRSSTGLNRTTTSNQWLEQQWMPDGSLDYFSRMKKKPTQSSSFCTSQSECETKASCRKKKQP